MILFDDKYKFFEMFNPTTGEYVRSGILTKNAHTGKSVDSGVDPFMRSFPSLIDIGVMGQCRSAKAGLCVNAGIDCYQSGKHIANSNMSITDYEKLIGQMSGKVFQVALGGRGDPNHHQDFHDILFMSRNNKVVPNYTTSGIGITDQEIAWTKRYCGAVAVSWQRAEHSIQAIERFVKAGCTTNIHYVLGRHTIAEAIDLLNGTIKLPDGINAIIFLLYKPVGQGYMDRVLDIAIDNENINTFAQLVPKSKVQVGFDSCSVPMVVNLMKDSIDMVSVDTCEGARFSMYISANMVATPCSFDQRERWGVDLHQHTISQAWNSEQFDDFRRSLRSACPSCTTRHECMGGCPIRPEIVLCNLPERKPYAT